MSTNLVHFITPPDSGTCGIQATEHKNSAMIYMNSSVSRFDLLQQIALE